MKIELHEITRGEDAIYAHVIVSDAPSEHLDAYAVATNSKGESLPCSTYTLENLEGFVVLVPTITEDVGIALFVQDNTGALASESFVITAEEAKKQSRKNTMLRNKVADRIRNSQEEGAHRVAVNVEYAFDYPDGSDLIRGSLAFSTVDAQLAHAQLHIEARGLDGALMDPSKLIVLGDRVDAHPDAPNLLERKMAFALHVPHDAGRLTLWVHSEQHLLDTVVLLTPWDMQQLKEHTRTTARSAEQNGDYERWFLQEHRTPENVLAAQRLLTWENPTVFSLIVPLFRTPVNFFQEMADSVLNQTYAHLQLVLVNASPEDEALAQAVAAYEQKDSRVCVVNLQENKGITENTNAGIAAATGDYLAFLDHDDVVEPDILYRYARAIQEDPSVGLLYCDEDKLCDGHYLSPLFKPDWNIDLLCSSNYVCHMLTVKKSIVDSLPPATSRYDGAQDHHMTFRVAETGCAIHHERHVLYHWRIHQGSTAATSEAKSYTGSVGALVVQEHFQRIGVEAQVSEATVPNTYQVDYPIQGNPLVSIVIATKDSVPLVKNCIDSILQKSTYGNFEVIIAENNSTDAQTFAYYDEVTKADGRVKMTVCETQGKVSVSSVYNQGAAAGSGEYIILLNNDTEVIAPDWIERLLGPCQREDVGAVGPKLLYPDGVIQHAGVMVRQMDKTYGFFEGPDNVGRGTVLYDSSNYYNFYNLTQDISVVTGACLMTKRSVYEELGGFDELLPNDYDDVDYCLKLRARDLLVVYEPAAVLYHHESVSRPNHTKGEQLVPFVYANGVIMQRYPRYYADCDPYFGPYLRNNRRDMQR